MSQAKRAKRRREGDACSLDTGGEGRMRKDEQDEQDEQDEKGKQGDKRGKGKRADQGLVGATGSTAGPDGDGLYLVSAFSLARAGTSGSSSECIRFTSYSLILFSLF